MKITDDRSFSPYWHISHPHLSNTLLLSQLCEQQYLLEIEPLSKPNLHPFLLLWLDLIHLLPHELRDIEVVLGRVVLLVHVYQVTTLVFKPLLLLFNGFVGKLEEEHHFGADLDWGVVEQQGGLAVSEGLPIDEDCVLV